MVLNLTLSLGLGLGLGLIAKVMQLLIRPVAYD